MRFMICCIRYYFILATLSISTQATQACPDLLEQGGRPSPPVVRGFQIGRVPTVIDDRTVAQTIGDAKNWGATVIRLQLKPQSFADDLKLSFWDAWPIFVKNTHRQIEIMSRSGIKVIPALMQPPPSTLGKPGQTWWDDDIARNGLIRIWEDLAISLYDLRDSIWAYDILNEPLDRKQLPLPPRQWKGLADEIIGTIRNFDKDSWIIFEVGPGSLFSGFDDLEPFGDCKIVYSAHFYYPQDFTHQGISNITGTDLSVPVIEKNIKYPGTFRFTFYDKTKLASFLNSADQFQQYYRKPIYVGEFSVVRWAPNPDSAIWLRHVVELFEERGWSWTYHAFREYHGWSLELNDKDNSHSNATTARGSVIRDALQKNRK